MDRISAIIVDDEPPARRRIAELLAREADVAVIGEFDRGGDAAAAIAAGGADLVFLDVQMPEVDGFGVVERVGAANMPVTVFVTAYDRYALQAFEVQALDYLLKPFSDERFEAALTRARTRVRAQRREEIADQLLGVVERYRTDTQNPAAARWLDRIVVKNAGRVTFLDVNDIDWIEAAGVYVRLHVGETRHVLREAIGALADKLDPQRFVRIHRSSVVRLDRIAELRQNRRGDYHVVLKDGTCLRLSRGYRERLQEILKQKL